MVDLLYCEFLKLKRSKMFFISIMGSFVAPIIYFLGWKKSELLHNDIIVTYKDLFSNINLNTLAIFGLFVYCVIGAYLFNREFTENTLKTILTIPISKTKFMLGKYLMLYIWIIGLTLITWTMTLILGVIGNATDFSKVVVIKSLYEFFLGASLLCLTLTPFVFITIWLKSIVPTMILSASVVMINIAISTDELTALFPWSAVYIISCKTSIPQYPIILSYISILFISFIGFIISIMYFNKQDIK